MRVESSRDPERYVHHWTMPKGFTREQAIEYFETFIKPRTMQIDRFQYDPKTGIAKTTVRVH